MSMIAGPIKIRIQGKKLVKVASISLPKTHIIIPTMEKAKTFPIVKSQTSPHAIFFVKIYYHTT